MTTSRKSTLTTSSRLFSFLLAYSLLRGLWWGVRGKNMWRKPAVTTAQFNATLKDLFYDPIRAQLSKPTFVDWDNHHDHIHIAREFAGDTRS